MRRLTQGVHLQDKSVTQQFSFCTLIPHFPSWDRDLCITKYIQKHHTCTSMFNRNSSLVHSVLTFDCCSQSRVLLKTGKLEGAQRKKPPWLTLKCNQTNNLIPSDLFNNNKKKLLQLQMTVNAFSYLLKNYM